MSVLPCDEAVKQYVGSWGEWMESVGVSWDDEEEDYGLLSIVPPKCDECSTFDCENCPATYEDDKEEDWQYD